MIILGIDPGSRITGYGLIQKEGKKVWFVDGGVIKTGRDAALSLRLGEIYRGLLGVIDGHLPDECAVEEVFAGDNPRTALMMGHARGAAILAAVNRGVPVAEYSAREVKRAVTGNGGASKEQVHFMVSRLLQLNSEASELTYDETDALAVALCHVHKVGG